MKERKKELGLTNEMISEKSGVPLGTVQKIFSGHTEAPRYSTLIAIEEVLKKPSMIGESVQPYSLPLAEKKEGYTIEDYYALPEDVRVELIDGIFYDMSSPTVQHQRLVAAILKQLDSFIDAHKGPCEAFLSPLDVRLDMDNKTMVQPDVMVICDPGKTEGGKRVEGAPDFVAEILSDSTFKKDFNLKRKKYKNAGVREYWMVDPENKVVYTCDFTLEKLIMEIHCFSEKIPVAIYGGECVIDLSRYA